MEKSAQWSGQRRVATEELALLVSELVDEYEASNVFDAALKPSWVSPSGNTVVVRSGTSVSACRVLQQNANDVFAEYAVLHRGVQVFEHKDFVWPHLRVEPANAAVVIPIECFNELSGFHCKHRTWWYKQYSRLAYESASLLPQSTTQSTTQSSSRIKKRSSESEIALCDVALLSEHVV